MPAVSAARQPGWRTRNFRLGRETREHLGRDRARPHARRTLRIAHHPYPRLETFYRQRAGLGDAVLDLEGGGFPARHLMRQTIIASVGERTLATVDLPPRATTFRVRVPADITVAKAFALILTMPHAGRPSDIANSGDMRLRGLYLRSITLERSVGEP